MSALLELLLPLTTTISSMYAMEFKLDESPMPSYIANCLTVAFHKENT